MSDKVLASLLNDSNIGVRKFAIRSVSDRNSDLIRQMLGEINSTEESEALRMTAGERASSLTADTGEQAPPGMGVQHS